MKSVATRPFPHSTLPVLLPQSPTLCCAPHAATSDVANSRYFSRPEKKPHLCVNAFLGSVRRPPAPVFSSFFCNHACSSRIMVGAILGFLQGTPPDQYYYVPRFACSCLASRHHESRSLSQNQWGTGEIPGRFGLPTGENYRRSLREERRQTPY